MFTQTLSLLRQYIPLPKRLADMGVSESDFYNNNQLYWDSETVPVCHRPAA
jgi:hypothetical protein